MKEKLLAIGTSLAALCACTILFSLIFAALYYFQIISQSTFHILNWIFGALSYLASGLILGIGIKKKALLHAFGLMIVFGILAFLMMDAYTIMNMIECITKLLAYGLGCMLVTMKRKD